MTDSGSGLDNEPSSSMPDRLPEEQERPKKIINREPGRKGSPTGPPEPTPAAQVVVLAKQLGVDPKELVKKYGADTNRRLKYPVRELPSRDGKRWFEHAIEITEGVRSLIVR